MIAALLLSTAAAAAKVPPGTVEETKNLPAFGVTKVYRPADIHHARGVVLFISGDGGWNLGVVDMARRLAPHAIVAGISMPAWQKRVEASSATCWYPAGELETAAQALEKQYKLPAYTAPILVGYSSGATVVYGALAQAPPTTFTGAVSLGFCPDLEVARRFCGKTGWTPTYDAKKHLGMLPTSKDIQPRADGKPRWIALQGLIDEVCSPPGTIDFVRQVPGGAVVQLEKVGHGFSVPARWGAAFDRAVDGLLEPRSVAEELHPPATSLGDLGLPLEVVWPESPRAVLIFLSGDGGWADLDSSVARALSQHGIAVVGWSSLRYFWSEKTPELLSKDLERVRAALPSDLPVFAGGYSFGAEVVPVVVKRLADGVAGLVLIAPSRYATFEVSPLDWLRSPSASDHPVDKAVVAASPLPVLCLVPSEDGDTGCPKAGGEGYERGELPGGHHFGGAYEELATRIASFVEKTLSR
jgi:type IV secretory pathway VirJ component